MTTTSLDEIVPRLQELDPDLVICMRRPWSATAAAVLTPPDENLAVPEPVRLAGFEYFLEVRVALDVAGVLRLSRLEGTADEHVRLLLHYADNDAYPDWLRP
jgi:hypothetical protein